MTLAKGAGELPSLHSPCPKFNARVAETKPSSIEIPIYQNLTVWLLNLWIAAAAVQTPSPDPSQARPHLSACVSAEQLPHAASRASLQGELPPVEIRSWREVSRITAVGPAAASQAQTEVGQQGDGAPQRYTATSSGERPTFQDGRHEGLKQSAGANLLGQCRRPSVCAC